MNDYVLVLETADFRRYAPITVGNAQGGYSLMTLCEELVDGRWEAFFSVVPC